MNCSVFYLVLTLLLMFSVGYGNAQQNLVPNSGFESYSTCPSAGNMEYYVSDWYSSFGSCDYFHQCGTSGFTVPLNYFGFQYPYEGNGYIGSAAFHKSKYVEYFQCKLNSVLKSGHMYCLELDISLSDSCQLAVDCLGVLFTTNQNIGVNYLELGTHADIDFDTLLLNPTNWIKLEGNYIAEGGEEYLTIGCFGEFSDVEINEFNPNASLTEFAYYYYDNINVSECEQYIDIPNIFTPNNDGINDILQIGQVGDLCEDCSLYIYNRWGVMIYYTDKPLHEFWDGKYLERPLNDGIYYYVFKQNFKIKNGTIHLVK